MPRRTWLMFAVLLLAGCNRQDTEALTRIAKKVQTRAETVSGNVRNSATSSWHVVGEAGAESRVAARMRWDQELADVTIEVLHCGTGVELRGNVHNLEQRRRAVMLAETTIGVEGVKDSLTVGGH